MSHLQYHVDRVVTKAALLFQHPRVLNYNPKQGKTHNKCSTMQLQLDYLLQETGEFLPYGCLFLFWMVCLKGIP